MANSMLEYEGFIYKLEEDPIIDNLYSKILGNVTPYIFDASSISRAFYYIKEDELYIKELEVCLKPEDIEYINPQFSSCLTVVQEERRAILNREIKVVDTRIAEFKDLSMDVDYTGTLKGHQVYVDEIYMKNKKIELGLSHLEKDVFVFEQGKLNNANSKIDKKRERLMERYTWNDEIEKNVIIDPEESVTFGYGMYFVDIDSINSGFLQNMAIFGCIVAYARGAISIDELCKQLLEYEKPRFRIEYMYYIEHGKYGRKELDLIPLVIERQDIDLLKRIFPYIDLAQYDEYKEKITSMMH